MSTRRYWAKSALYGQKCVFLDDCVKMLVTMCRSEIRCELKYHEQASPAALATMAATFPNAMQEETFMKAVAEELKNLGFKR